MTTAMSEMREDESIYQDFELDDDIITSIAPEYRCYVEILEGLTVVHTSELQKNIELTKYELRLGSSTLEPILEPGHTYWLRVFEENSTTNYKQFIHEEKIKVKF